MVLVKKEELEDLLEPGHSFPLEGFLWEKPPKILKLKTLNATVPFAIQSVRVGEYEYALYVRETDIEDNDAYKDLDLVFTLQEREVGSESVRMEFVVSICYPDYFGIVFARETVRMLGVAYTAAYGKGNTTIPEQVLTTLVASEISNYLDKYVSIDESIEMN